MPLTCATLVERDRELARLSDALEAVGSGAGRLVVVDGPAGIGKSSVLTAAAEAGRERHSLVLGAVAGEFERDLGFGVVRQLLESMLVGLGAREQRALLSGAAGLARPLLLPSGGWGSAAAQEPAAQLTVGTLPLANCRLAHA